jgi:hypothetical protein
LFPCGGAEVGGAASDTAALEFVLPLQPPPPPRDVAAPAVAGTVRCEGSLSIASNSFASNSFVSCFFGRLADVLFRGGRDDEAGLGDDGRRRLIKDELLLSDAVTVLSHLRSPDGTGGEVRSRSGSRPRLRITAEAGAVGIVAADVEVEDADVVADEASFTLAASFFTGADCLRLGFLADPVLDERVVVSVVRVSPTAAVSISDSGLAWAGGGGGVSRTNEADMDAAVSAAGRLPLQLFPPPIAPAGLVRAAGEADDRWAALDICSAAARSTRSSVLPLRACAGFDW